MNKLIYNLSIIATGIVALSSMIVSYMSIRDLASSYGIIASIIYPVCIDGGMITATMARLYFSQKGKITYYPVICLITFSIFSIILNALDAKDITGAFIYAVAPISLILTSEITAEIIKKEIKIKPVRRYTKKTIKTPKNTDDNTLII